MISEYISLDVFEYTIIPYISYNDITNILFCKKWNYNAKFDKWILDIMCKNINKYKNYITHDFVSNYYCDSFINYNLYHSVEFENFIKKDVIEYNLLYKIDKYCKINLTTKKKQICFIYVNNKLIYKSKQSFDDNINHHIIGLKYNNIYYIYDFIFYSYNHVSLFNVIKDIFIKTEIKDFYTEKKIYNKLLETKSMREFFQHKHTKSLHKYIKMDKNNI